MPIIIDNRKEKLVEHIAELLHGTEAARFAVGYFYVSGLESVTPALAEVQELRLLIGNTTNRETLEQMVEGYRRLDLVRSALEAEHYPKRSAVGGMFDATAGDVRSTLAALDQTDAGAAVVHTLVRMIEEGRLKVRVYMRGRLHAKAYIFTYPAGKQYEDGMAIVGSSNFTISGVTHNTELNVAVHGNDAHAELVAWFDELWDEAEDFDQALMREMRASWPLAAVRPYDIYMKTLYALVQERLEGDGGDELLAEDEITGRLADFQRVAVRQAVQMIREVGGCFVADVVGLGKSYIGAAIVKQFERTDHARSLIVCPAPLVPMWERYNEVYDLNARVLSMGFLKEGTDGHVNVLLGDIKYRDRDFVLVDESHNFRNSGTQRYTALQQFLATGGRRSCFLTATPLNQSVWDVYNQTRLFHQEDITQLPIDPPHLRQYFNLIEEGKRQLPTVLTNILIRRTRNHVLRWYGYDAETHARVNSAEFDDYLQGRRRAYVIVAGKHQFFPRRTLQTIDYSIEATYAGLYQQLLGYIGKPRKALLGAQPPEELTYARYGLWNYVDKSMQRKPPYDTLGKVKGNLRGLMRVLLFKRFESSVYAFQQTIGRLIKGHQIFLQALAGGIVPAGDDAQRLIYEAAGPDDDDLMDALGEAAAQYRAADFDVPLLHTHLAHDLALLTKIRDLVAPITAEHDDKLQTLKKRLQSVPLNTGKCLIFTQYADTARYLYRQLDPGGRRADIALIYSGDKDKARLVARFSPRSNPDQVVPGDSELDMLVATDVLAEGLNLQDCDKIINYDLHWNPVRLIQRFGRIDRIGSEHDRIYGFNFLPETALDQNLGLRERLARRIDEIHATIGEDSAILDPGEALNPEAMYAIYEGEGAKLAQYEEQEEAGLVNLNEAEEFMRRLRSDDPEEYKRIAELRDGIRTARTAGSAGLFVFCQAGRYQQLFLADPTGAILSRDLPSILGLIQCTPELPAEPLPADYNAAVMRVLGRFAEEAQQRFAEQQHTLSHTPGQRYILKELRLLFEASDDDDTRGQITILETAFRRPLTPALGRRLNQLRRSGTGGAPLYKTLIDLYYEHNLRDGADRRGPAADAPPLPRILCSEGLV